MTPPRFVAIGECMIEMAPSGGADQFRMNFAGDSFNTAWYARKLLSATWQVDYVTAVGTDAVSDRMVAFFESSGIGTAHVGRKPERGVGLYLISLDRGERSFTYWRGQSAARLLAEDPGRLDAALKGASLAYVSGITLAILAPEARARLLAALDCGRRAGMAIAFDPNLRPRLWPNVAAMRAAISDTARISDIVLPSHEDEAAYFGDGSPEATLERYLGAGATTVVVKNGAERIVAADPRGRFDLRPEPVRDVRDTTAAGDSFNAGFLACHLSGGTLAESVVAGSVIAAKVIRGPGALVEI
ncbi:MAG: sugar kinase [Rhodobacteraceae bacterium]|nr:sugar kinase [Paracoccaceae bacterium]